MKKFIQTIVASVCVIASTFAYGYNDLYSSSYNNDLYSSSYNNDLYSSQLYTPTSYYSKSNDNYLNTSSSVDYYTNSYGEKVQSPTYYNSKPRGATAECRDGTYSFSRSRRGTCSGHGGVSQW